MLLLFFILVLLVSVSLGIVSALELDSLLVIRRNLDSALLFDIPTNHDSSAPIFIVNARKA